MPCRVVTTNNMMSTKYVPAKRPKDTINDPETRPFEHRMLRHDCVPQSTVSARYCSRSEVVTNEKFQYGYHQYVRTHNTVGIGITDRKDVLVHNIRYTALHELSHMPSQFRHLRMHFSK